MIPKLYKLQGRDASPLSTQSHESLAAKMETPTCSAAAMPRKINDTKVKQERPMLSFWPLLYLPGSETVIVNAFASISIGMN